MKKLLMGAAVLFMFGCEDLTGTLNVNQSFKVNAKGASVIESGSYKTSLDFKKNKIVAVVEVADSKVKMNLNVPENTVVPANGSFELSASESGQPFDVAGVVQTTVTKSEPQRGFESCTYQDYDTVCDQFGCHQIVVSRPGQQYTEYYVKTTKKNMSFDVVEKQSTKAHFKGASTTSERVIIYQDMCR